MHEVSLVQALFDQVDRAITPYPSAALRQVTVRIGALAGVEHELFRTAFEGCKSERGYARAELGIERVEASWACAACGAPVASPGPLRCAACGAEATLLGGGDLVLQRLELEVSDV